MSEESVWSLGNATCLIHASVPRLTRWQRDPCGRQGVETEMGRSWEMSMAKMIQFCYHRAPGLYVWGRELRGTVPVDSAQDYVAWTLAYRSNESNFYVVQMALYLPPNTQQIFLGVAIVRMMGTAKQMLAWSREGGRQRKKRWERAHVYDTKDEPSYSPINVPL